ncbi:MAG: MATE family efflux transporter [Sphingobacteriales bacterium]|nr:MAG: MATE family efflux transporter [Sphingobacteriales bacterium]
MSSTNTTRKLSFFQLFRQAIKGDIKDFTTGSIDKAIFLLAVPMVMEMALESLFAIVDIYFVNKVGAHAVATVILTESVLTILYSVAWGLSMGVTAMVARRAGEKKFEAAGEIASQAILICLVFSVIISVIGIAFPKELLGFMGAEREAIESGYHYPQIMLGTNMVIMLLFVNNAVFRGAGDAAIAMRALWIANIINIILDPLFILGIGPFPKLGVNGAGVATSIGRGIGVLYQLYFLFKGNGLVKIYAKHFKANWNIIRQLFKISAGGMGQFIIGSCSWIFLNKIIAESGDSRIVDGYGTAIRICIFTLLPAWGMANAAATLVGQNLGAGLPDRAEKSVWRTAFITSLFFVLVGILFFLVGENMMQFFTKDALVVSTGKQCLRFLSVGYLFFAYGMVISQAFNGAGDTMTPTILNLFIFWGIQIPVAYLLAKYWHWGPTGVYVAISFAESILAVVAILLFKRGKWKKIKV